MKNQYLSMGWSLFLCLMQRGAHPARSLPHFSNEKSRFAHAHAHAHAHALAHAHAHAHARISQHVLK